ncbi:MAG: hypothetical protein JWR44_1458 [Hymenobacter sp.]|jgi:ABC-type transport system substrate-binding protein|nr:hypothetical protein [Hymenobacter sp.]
MYRVKHKFPGRTLLSATTILLLYSCRPDRSQTESIRIRWPHDPETLDPLRLPNQAAIDANNLLHVSLLQVDLSKHEYAPALAESLPTRQLLGDSLVKLTYSIRPQATWDNGRPVLARDVAFTLKLMFCPGLPNEGTRNQYRFIQKMVPDSTNPRRFALVCRGQALEYVHASGDFFVLPEAAIDPRGHLRRFSLSTLQNWSAAAAPDSGLQAVARRYLAADPNQAASRVPGCGPYQLVKWEKDRYLSFRRKPRWWADQLRPAPFVLQARPARLDFMIIPDVATATLALQRGDIDLFAQMPAREFARLRASSTAKAKLTFSSSPSYDVVMAGFNTRRPVLADALTRRALSRCFDAAGLLQATQLNEGLLTTGIISPIDRANYNSNLRLVAFDPNAAAELLRKAGWQRAAGTEAGWFRRGPDGVRQQLRLAVRYRADENIFATAALQFQSAAAGLGIPVVLRPTESGIFPQALRLGDFDVYVGRLRGNPFMFNFTSVLHSLGVGVGNTTGFSTPASDHLIEAITKADTEAHRAQLLRRFQALMQQEVPLVPLFFLPNRIAADRRLTGLHITSLKPGYSVTGLARAPEPAAP